MKEVTISGLNYREFIKFINYLDYYVNSLNAKIPEQYEEKAVFLHSCFDFLLKKIFAQAPPRGNFTDYASRFILRYIFSSKDEKSTEKFAPILDEKIEKLSAISEFLKNKNYNNINEFIKGSNLQGLINQKRKLIEEKITTNDASELLNAIKSRKASIANFENFWQDVLNYENKFQIYREIKSSLVISGYISLFTVEKLKEVLLSENTYINLSQYAIEEMFIYLNAMFLDADENEIKKILELGNGPLYAFNEKLQKLESISDEAIDILRIFKIHCIEYRNEYIKKIIKAINLPGYNKLFYIEYDVTRLSKENFEKIDECLNLIVEELIKGYKGKKGIEEKIELWNDDYFKVLWLFLIVWFRWYYLQGKSIKKF